MASSDLSTEKCSQGLFWFLMWKRDEMPMLLGFSGEAGWDWPWIVCHPIIAGAVTELLWPLHMVRATIPHHVHHVGDVVRVTCLETTHGWRPKNHVRSGLDEDDVGRDRQGESVQTGLHGDSDGSNDGREAQ